MLEHDNLCASHAVLGNMTLTSARLGATWLVVAGVYQLTPLKRVCLQKCQTPFGFLMHHWRRGLDSSCTLILTQVEYANIINTGSYCADTKRLKLRAFVCC